MTRKQKNRSIRIALTALLTVVLLLLPINGTPRFLLFLIPYLLIGYDVLAAAFRGLIAKQITDESLLMAIATVGALVLGAIGEGDYTEAIAVLWLYQIGELLQSLAIGKSRKSIASLMDIRPDHATIQTSEGYRTVDPAEVEIGSIIRVLPGERIPIDGIVLSGRSELDTSALTGESLPRCVQVFDRVASGCICLSGMILIRTDRLYSDSAVARILALVEDATLRKSRTELYLTRFARIYTPTVCLLALLLATVPPLLCLILSLPQAPLIWLYRALSFLVASCPCALLISIPMAFFATLGTAGRIGVLIKGSEYVEVLSSLSCLAFDKTGTLTEGKFTVHEIHLFEGNEEELCRLAVELEQVSSHPIARGILASFPHIRPQSAVCDLIQIGGMGMEGRIESHLVAAGNEKWMSERGIFVPSHQAPDTTAVYLARDGVCLGYLQLSDTPKSNAIDAIGRLNALGIRRTVMLTGDRSESANSIASILGITEVHAELLPQDKAGILSKMIRDRSKEERIGFVGDGINDAPSLSLCDVGIAMGALGSEAAMESADVVLMDDDLMRIPQAVSLAKRCMRIVRLNTVIILFAKVAALLLVSLGIGGMWLAIFSDVGIMLLTLLFSLSLFRSTNG